MRSVHYLESEIDFEMRRAESDSSGVWRNKGFYATIDYYDARKNEMRRDLVLCTDEEIMLHLASAVALAGTVMAKRRDLFDRMVVAGQEQPPQPDWSLMEPPGEEE